MISHAPPHVSDARRPQAPRAAGSADFLGVPSSFADHCHVRIYLVAIGERMPTWVQEGFDDYASRLPRELRLNVREVRPGKRVKGADTARLIDEESKRLWAAVPKGARAIALDRVGREMDNAGWARELETAMAHAIDLAFLIGGPDGLSAAGLANAAERWSLSRLTFAHPLVRVVVAEQIYRAWSIIAKLPYHR
jgi:23S rRNA (pseudouridine1915-N3)-methyltransferase